MIYLNYPSDREDYRPPEGVDLVQWLADYNLLVSKRQPDMQIASTTAIHTRVVRSSQSYASNHYFLPDRSNCTGS